MAILKKNITSYGIVLGSIGIIDACICIFANIFGLINMDVVLLHLMKTKSFHSDKLAYNFLFTLLVVIKFISLLSSFLFIYGVVKRQRLYLLPWLTQILVFLVPFVFLTFSILDLDTTGKIIFNVVSTTIYLCLWAFGYFLYKQLSIYDQNGTLNSVDSH